MKNREVLTKTKSLEISMNLINSLAETSSTYLNIGFRRRVNTIFESLKSSAETFGIDLSTPKGKEATVKLLLSSYTHTCKEDPKSLILKKSLGKIVSKIFETNIHDDELLSYFDALEGQDYFFGEN